MMHQGTIVGDTYDETLKNIFVAAYVKAGFDVITSERITFHGNPEDGTVAWCWRRHMVEIGK